MKRYAVSQLRKTIIFFLLLICIGSISFDQLILFPNDTDFPNQDNLDNTGQNGGIIDADIDAPEAWSITTGDSATIIAIIDSGADIADPEIQPKLWVNPGEIPANGIDDDANGYIDDINGWNFGAAGVGDDNLQDIFGHGTQMLSIAGAVTDNNAGIAGVCWNCQIMVLKDGDALPDDHDTADAIDYAVANGADVISISTGYDVGALHLHQAVISAHNAGIPVVASTRNDGGTTIFFPAAFAESIAIGATDNRDLRAAISTSGLEIDLVSPGVNINCIDIGGGTITVTGTSPAVAQVSGAIGLIQSAHPNLYGVEDIRAILRDSADRVGMGPIPATEPNWNTFYGSGRLNAYEALSESSIIFTDVLPSAWYESYIRYIYSEGVVQGFPDGTFRPGNNVTRSEVLKMTYGASGEALNPTNPDPGFQDVNTGDWFYPLVADAHAKGFITGNPCQSGVGMCFRPNEPVNRAEGAKMISMLFHIDIANLDTVMNTTTDNRISFPDVHVDDWFHPYIYWMANSELRSLDLPNGITNVQRIVSGRPSGNFDPEDPVNRAEMSKIIANTMLYFSTGSAPGTKFGDGISFASIGYLYGQIFDSLNPNPPTRLGLEGGNQQIVTGSVTMAGDEVDVDGDELFYFWNASGGSFSTTDPTNFSEVTWSPPDNSAGDIFNINVIRGDRRGYIGKGSFYFIVKDVTGVDREIDIKPGSGANPINPKSRGKIPVAILSSAEFDAVAVINRTTVTFGRTGDEDSMHMRRNGPNCGECDVNSDEFSDLVCHFYTERTGFLQTDTRGFLKGKTIHGERFIAIDLITIVGTGFDYDRDGSPDEVEDGGPNRGDGNNDGISDSAQDNVTTFFAAESGNPVTLESSPGCINTGVVAINSTSLPFDPLGLPMPEGLIGFTLDSCLLSDTLIVFHGRSNFEGFQYRRYGRTMGNPTEHWYTLDGTTFGSTTVDGISVATVRFQLRDGGIGDDDLTQNGRIVDPGGPAGMVRQANIPTMTSIGAIVFVILIVSSSLFVLRRYRF
jgi:hypothetical protein